MTTTSPAKQNSLGTILVVEDHPVVLEAVHAMLCDQGFRVLAAANSTEAIRLEKATSETIHLLLSDVVMPGMSGPVVAQILQEHRPEMRVMLMSGYPNSDMPVSKQHGWSFIEKPFVSKQLVESINELLHCPEEHQL
jgi:two-component system, cell cycle sensor histidine kinase and response regulator CckA